MADLPKDLSLVRQTVPDKDYFRVSVKNLKLNQVYAIQFQWIYEDGQLGQWSPSYIFTTSNETSPAVPTSTSVPETSTGSIPVTLSSFPTNARRVDVVITGGVFGTSKIAHSFSAAGVATIAAPAGFYTVQLRSVSPSGVTSSVGTSYTITVADVGETIQTPTNPNGFSSKRILAGIEVSWAGTYASSTFTGFEAINIYAGNSATATSGTYEQVGVLTGNNVKNTIVIPLGTYVVYGQAVYIHAAAVNKSGTVGTIQANVTNQALGPGKATDADINDGAVVISKLASDVLTVGNLKAGDINATSFIRAGTASSARVELSSANISGGPLAGLHIYNSSGTAILSAPLTGGLSITGNGTFTGSITGASGQFDGDLGASGGDFRVRSGQITALSGVIGGWRISDSVLKNNANTYPNVLLDPVNSKIELRTDTGASDTGNYIKMDTSSGLRIGSGSSPTFSVAMDGSLSFQKIVGSNSIRLDNTSFRAVGSNGTVTIGYDGNVTMDSTGNVLGGAAGSILTLSGTATDTAAGEPAVVVSTTISPGSFSMYQGSVFGSAAVSYYQYLYNNQLNIYATGLTEITWRNYYTNPASPTYNYSSSRVSTVNDDQFRPIGVTPFGGQYMGQRLFSGTATSNSTINSDINNRGIANQSLNGDFYFSTA
jgi:hypothetical protein